MTLSLSDPESLRVHVKVFDGPLDLLLHLIHKNELDIMDIPIATIMEQYLEHLELMQDLNLEVAGEFLLMAATLTQIKSKMLLPPEEGPGGAEEALDPRAELVMKLLEYQKFKEAATTLESRHWLGRDVFKRGGHFAEVTGIETSRERPLVVPSTLVLVDALKVVLDRISAGEGTEIEGEHYSVFDQMKWVLSEISVGEERIFDSLFDTLRTRRQVIATFLALLELIRLHRVNVLQESDSGTILIRRVEISDSALGEKEIDEYL
ncbi:MAG: segregation/condensation protein A [Deltaproteobacteria bacterium]|nr:segregation/condensation protein A [Deltaproteobacteria bacterium]